MSEPLTAEEADAVYAALTHAANYSAYRGASVAAFLGALSEHGLTVATLDAARTPALDERRLTRALQANQDKTYLDIANHRHHCGGTCAAAIAREYALATPPEPVR